MDQVPAQFLTPQVGEVEIELNLCGLRDAYAFCVGMKRIQKAFLAGLANNLRL